MIFYRIERNCNPPAEAVYARASSAGSVSGSLPVAIYWYI